MASVSSSDADVAAIAALEEPTRRRTYDVVAASSEPLSRDQVAAILKLPRTTAAFHLERLAAEGLLDVTHGRRSGRTGPGSGRPAKLYQRSARHIGVSIPPRHYELAARLLIEALEESSRSGAPAAQELDQQARHAGTELGRSTHSSTVVEALAQCGFEPRHDDESIVLGNCPFQALASNYPITVCGMNLHLINGLLEGNDEPNWSAQLDPAPDLCCVRLQRAA